MFVDSSVELPLAKACKFGSLTLLDRILESQVGVEFDEDSSWSLRSLMQSETFYQHHQFTYSLSEAVRRSDLDMTKWLFLHFRGGFSVSRKVVEEAATVGDIEILEYFLDNDVNVGSDGEKSNEEMDLARHVLWGGKDAANAIRAGRPEVALWLYEYVNVEHRHEHETLKAAAAMGDVQLFEWLQEKIDLDIEISIREVAANGHLDMVKALYEQDFEEEDMHFDRGVLVAAAEKGQLDVVRWLIELDGDLEEYHSDSDLDSESDGYRSGGESTHTAVNLMHRPHITNVGGEASVAMDVAAMNGHLEVAKYLFACVDKPLNKKGRWREKERLDRTLEAIWGMFDREHYSTYLSEETMLVAARNGWLDVVKWLYDEPGINPRINLFGIYDFLAKKLHTAIDIAATNGHLLIVQYLHEVGQQAAALELDWQQRKREKVKHKLLNDPFYYSLTYTNGVKPERPIRAQCTTEAMDGAAANGHFEVVRWLHENRTEGCTTDAMDCAARNGHLELVQYLHEHRKEGCTLNAMDGAASNGHLEVVKWLHGHRSEGCSSKAMDGAASGGYLAVVQWLHETRHEGCTSAAMDGAAGGGHLEVVKWLHHNRPEGCTSAAMDGAAAAGALDVVVDASRSTVVQLRH
ncbi:hypothetical protein PR003_g29627, partial [Phytophthora rubi]